jgi:hypothetical protein
MKKKKEKKFSFQKWKKKKFFKNETIYSYALACFTKYIYIYSDRVKFLVSESLD